MIEYFEKQLELEETNPVTEELLLQLGGKSIYSDYQVGDVILHFLEEIKYAPTRDDITLQLHLSAVTEREMDKLEEDFEFVGMRDIFPVLYRKETA